MSLEKLTILDVVPYTPTGLNFTEQYHRNMESTVTIEWNQPPRNLSPAAVVDEYIISFLPAPVSHPTMNVLSSPPFNVTLSHNTLYGINLTAVNCAGESETFVSSGMQISKSESMIIAIKQRTSHYS